MSSGAAASQLRVILNVINPKSYRVRYQEELMKGHRKTKRNKGRLTSRRKRAAGL